VTSSPDPTHPEPAPDFVLQITPEPTDDERDALVAALLILIAEPVAAFPAGQPRTTPSRWARAGRESAFNARRVQRARFSPS
jgi:hypothetical protein